jgi:hypothetical protein
VRRIFILPLGQNDMKSEGSGGHHRDLKLNIGSEPFWREEKAYRNVGIGSCWSQI